MTTHDKDKIIAAAKEAGFQVIFDGKFGRDDYFSSMASIPSVERLYAIAFEAGRQAEREECAKDAEYYAQYSTIATIIAKDIRARGDSK